MTTQVDSLQLANTIATKLCDEAIRSDGRATWLGDEKENIDGRWEVVCKAVDGDLYGGTAGVGLFLARISVATRESRFRALALEALTHAADWTRRTRPAGSLYSGSAGVAAVLAEAAQLLDEPRLAEEASSITRAALDRLPEESQDLLSGRAGSILALLYLARALPLESALDAARRLGDQLVNARLTTPFPGASWNSDIGPNEPPLCGLSHGASGIALALEELGLACNEKRYSEVAAAAATYERAWFQNEDGNWPDLREYTRAKRMRGERPGFPALWCHGAVGIGLVRLRQYELTGSTIYAVEAEAALIATERQLAEALDAQRIDLCVCHGLASVSELFIEAARVFEQPLLRERALDCAQIAAKCGVDGKGPWPCGIPDGGENPSLMVGLAGIGMMFLRVADAGSQPVGILYARGVMVPRVIVQLVMSEQVSDLQARAVELAARLPGSRVERISRRGRVLIRLPQGMSADAAAKSLSECEGVEYAEPDTKDHTSDG